MHYEKFQDGTVKCIENDIPFELSLGWAWCRLSNIAAPRENSFVDGPFGSNLKTEHYTDNREVRIIQLNNIGEFCWKNLGVKYTTYIHAETLKRCKTYPNDIVIAKMMPAGRAIIVPNLEKEYVISSDCVRLQTSNNVDRKFIMYMLNSRIINEQVVKSVHGIGRSRTSLTKLKSLIIPIPPLNEQKLIVKNITYLFSLINNLQDNKQELVNLSALIKSKILDLAIRGQLVPQDPNDEPASVLLERIRAEKEELIKQGKIKRDKKESIIFRGEDNSYYEKINNFITLIDNKLPYTVPNNWNWCSLFDIAEIVMGSSPNGMTINSSNKGMEFHQGKIFFTDKYLDMSDKTTTHPTKISPANSVLLCVRAPVGEINISNREICIGRGLASIHPYNYINTEWLFYWLKTYKNDLNKKATGSTFVAITVDTIKNMLIPLPPFEEQNRILQAIDNIFLTIKLIEKSLK